MTYKRLKLMAMAAAIVVVAPLASANEFEPQLRELVTNQLNAIAANPLVVSAVKAQNEANRDLDQAGIDALDGQWRAEAKAGGGPLIDATLATEVSDYLKSIKGDSDGLYAEIFVMDAKGLNVGQSDITSDYWQGDEAKHQQTYGAGAGSVLIDEIEFDESSEAFVTQVSVTVVDPDGGSAIGAVTFGVAVEQMF